MIGPATLVTAIHSTGRYAHTRGPLVPSATTSVVETSAIVSGAAVAATPRRTSTAVTSAGSTSSWSWIERSDPSGNVASARRAARSSTPAVVWTSVRFTSTSVAGGSGTAKF